MADNVYIRFRKHGEMYRSVCHLYKLTVVALLCAMAVAGCSGPALLDDKMLSLLDKLDVSLDSRESIIAARAMEIKQLRDSIGSTPDYDVRCLLYDRLIASGRHFQVDSMLSYHSMARKDAIDFGDEERALFHHIKSIELLPLKMLVHEAIVSLDSVDVATLSPHNRRAYYETARQVYLYLMTIYSPGYVNYDYLKIVGEYSDSLMAEVGSDDPRYMLYQGTSHVTHNNLSLGIATLLDYLSGIDSHDPTYMDAVGMLALAYYMRNRYDDWAYCTALSALAENEGAILDGESLRQLGGWLYSCGDVSRSYDYIVTAENNESRSGAVVRSVHVSDAVPHISAAYRESERASTLLLCVIVGCLIVILALVIVLFIRRAREKAELSDAKEELAQANATKEVYLGRFLSLCYIYMDKVEDMGKVVSRKIAAGQIEDLYHLMKTGKMEEEQRQLFYKEFDDAFMHIYPTFVSDVNKLMRDGMKFSDDDSGNLTPELRILAFMRMGLDDSGKIARFLNLSVNTIYTYRNRMKNRAINRDEFESKVMEIGRL